jgi:hypothetical protein
MAKKIEERAELRRTATISRLRDGSCSPVSRLRQIALPRALPTFPCRYATADETAGLLSA